ncbi:MAG: GtrA family protein [Pseudomonadota bacterium]|nr:GtrA family protein [Pseudomonadota bacterium]
MRTDHAVRFSKFVLNGLVATAVHYCVLYVLVEGALVAVHGLANAIGAAFGITASYLGNKFVVFSDQASNPRDALRFVLLYGAVFAWNFAFMFAWSDLGGLSYHAGFVIAVGVATMASYLGNHYWVFAR